MSIGTNLNNEERAFVRSTATIVTASTVSTAVDLQGRVLVGLELPASLSGSSMTFQASYDGVNYQALYNNENSAISVAYTQGRNYTLDPNYIAGVKNIKLVVASAPAAAKAITVISRKID